MNLTLQAVRRLAKTPAMHALLDSVDRDLRQATDLLEELKSLNRRETYRLQRLDLVHEVKQLVEQLRIVPRSPIFIDFTEGNDKLVVAGDLSRLRRVWQNIIRNAMDAAETGKKEERPRLMITVKRTGKFARLQFRDNAGGIPRQRLVRVFEPFFTTKGEKNRGLGLFIARKIMSEHHGKIRVVSRKPFTRVTLDLPLHAAATRSTPERTAP
ncbi:MAG: ATP-binding protein [Spirochaetes bacterium]|nr:ATP-binding protein [Spirochaetota bacterium]